MNNVLIVVAHPDDEVLGCGATIAKHTRAGDKVKIIFLADGFSSRSDGITRCGASKCASEILECETPIFFDYPDNQLDSVPLLKIVQDLEGIFYDFKPNIVYTHHFGDLNVDHQVTHRAVMTVCRPQPGFYVKEIYSFEILSSTHWQSAGMRNTFIPNYFIDVDKFLDEKIRALQCYGKELRRYPHARSYESVKNLAKVRGSIIGVEYAEAFMVERVITG